MPCHAIPAQFRIGEDLASAAAVVLDISTAGIRLETGSPLEAGCNVTVWFRNTVAAGEVRFCRLNRYGSFDVGLRLLDVVNRI